jgi:hypothetical protein
MHSIMLLKYRRFFSYASPSGKFHSSVIVDILFIKFLIAVKHKKNFALLGFDF